jgi:hypothetical protein
LLQIEQGASIAGGLSSTDYRPEQKPPKVDLYPREQKSQKQEAFRGAKSSNLSSLESPSTSTTPPAGQ